MKKLLFFLALMCGVSLSWAYNFSAVAPSGQTLYYNIVNVYAQVTAPEFDADNGFGNWGAYTKPTGELSIPESVTYNGITLSVTSIGDDAFDNCFGLTSVTIPNSVTSIGDWAFSGCFGLTSVTIPNSVTSIGDGAFNRCSGLTSVTIPNSVTSIGWHAFYGCSNVDTLYYNARNLTTTSDWGNYNSYGFRPMKLKHLVIGDSVQTLPDYVFYNQDRLTNVTIPNSVTSIGGGAFSGCSNVDTLYYNARNLTTTSSWGNSSSNYNSYGFRPMKFKHLVIGDSVQTLPNYVFYNQYRLTSVTIPNSVTSIGDWAFGDCGGLTSVTIGNSVTTIGEGAFAYCSGLTSVTMEGVTPPTLGSDVFYDNASNRKIYVPCGAYETYYNATNGWSTYRSALSDPMVDIDVVLATEAERGSVVIIPLHGQEVSCDSTVVVRATANYGYHFDHWSTSSTQAQDTIAVSGDTVITAYFAKNLYAVNVVSSDTVRGYVTGSDTIDYLDSITISAVANYGYHFTRWDDNDTHSVRTVQVTQNQTYTAYFDYNQYQLTVASANTAQGSCSGSGAYNYLSDRTISATANYGYHFARWNDGNTDNPRTIQLTQDTIFSAEFAKNQYEITLLSDDASLGSVDGGGSFDYLDTITLTAAPIDHYHFVHWNDGNRENPRQWVVTEDAILTAYFAIDTHSVTVVSCDPTRGMVTSSGSEFEYLSPCTVTATAYTGFVFAGWSNGVTANPYTFAVQNDVELTAIFVSEDELMFTITVEADDPTMGSVSGGGMAMSGGEVTIHAVANEGYHFVRWNDNDTNADRTVIVTEDATYTAYFAADQTEGIDEVEQMPTIVVRGNSIAVGNAQGQMLSIYDITGRMIVSEQAVDGKQYLVPHSGVYMVQIGNHKAQKVVVVR